MVEHSPTILASEEKALPLCIVIFMCIPCSTVGHMIILLFYYPWHTVLWSCCCSVYNHTRVLLSLIYRVLVTLLLWVQSYSYLIIPDIPYFDRAIALRTIIPLSYQSRHSVLWPHYYPWHNVSATLLFCVQTYSCPFPRAHLHMVGMSRFMSDTNQPSLPTPFYSGLVSISVYMALSTVFHSITSPDYSPFSHSVCAVLLLFYWSFLLHISL